MITPTPPVTTTVTADPANKNKPDKTDKPDNPNKPDKTKVPKDKPKKNGNASSATCPAPGTNPTGLALASSSGVSYNQIMSWYCQGMSWKQIEHRLGGKLKKTPKP
jgi:hypothetical protein